MSFLSPGNINQAVNPWAGPRPGSTPAAATGPAAANPYSSLPQAAQDAADPTKDPQNYAAARIQNNNQLAANAKNLPAPQGGPTAPNIVPNAGGIPQYQSVVGQPAGQPWMNRGQNRQQMPQQGGASVVPPAPGMAPTGGNQAAIMGALGTAPMTTQGS